MLNVYYDLVFLIVWRCDWTPSAWERDQWRPDTLDDRSHHG